MPIEHFGINVPDVDEAIAYFDEFMPMVGYMRFFPTGYVPNDWNGVQLFVYSATEDGEHSRLRTGLSHIAFMVPTRAEVHAVHDWAVGKGHEILHAPKPFPEYGETCYATHFLNPLGMHLEVTCFAKPD